MEHPTQGICLTAFGNAAGVQHLTVRRITTFAPVCKPTHPASALGSSSLFSVVGVPTERRRGLFAPLSKSYSLRPTTPPTKSCIRGETTVSANTTPLLTSDRRSSTSRGVIDPSGVTSNASSLAMAPSHLASNAGLISQGLERSQPGARMWMPASSNALFRLAIRRADARRCA